MTRSQLVEALSLKQTQLQHRDIDACVDIILEALTTALVRDDRVEIRGFGSFDLRHRAARTGRHPKTGKSVHIAPARLPHFKAGMLLRKRVNEITAGIDSSDGEGHSAPSPL